MVEEAKKFSSLLERSAMWRMHVFDTFSDADQCMVAAVGRNVNLFELADEWRVGMMSTPSPMPFCEIV